MKKKNEEVKESKDVDQDLVDELKVVQTQIAEHKARLNGGFSKSLGRPVLAIGKELKSLDRKLRALKIEVMYDQPLNPLFQFQTRDEYRAVIKEDKEDLIKELEVQNGKILEQKEMMNKKLPELEKLEKELLAKQQK